MTSRHCWSIEYQQDKQENLCHFYPFFPYKIGSTQVEICVLLKFISSIQFCTSSIFLNINYYIVLSTQRIQEMKYNCLWCWRVLIISTTVKPMADIRENSQVKTTSIYIFVYFLTLSGQWTYNILTLSSETFLFGMISFCCWIE